MRGGGGADRNFPFLWEGENTFSQEGGTTFELQEGQRSLSRNRGRAFALVPMAPPPMVLGIFRLRFTVTLL